MVLLGAAFAFGLIAGGASIAMAARRGKADWIWRGSRGPSRQSIGGGYAGALDQRLKLGLTAEVRDSINVIAKRGMAEMDSIRKSISPALDSLRQSVDSVWQRVAPQVDSGRNRTRSAIRDLLSPVQREKFDSANQAADQQRRRTHDQHNQHNRGGPRGQRGMGPPGGPGERGGGIDRDPY
jgi:hypothetical protein